jgi:hypothetical protein
MSFWGDSVKAEITDSNLPVKMGKSGNSVEIDGSSMNVEIGIWINPKNYDRASWIPENSRRTRQIVRSILLRGNPG